MAAACESSVFMNNPFSRDPKSRQRSKPRRVERARIKNHLKTIQQEPHHQHHQPSTFNTETHEPDLLQRFFSLPPELRNHIYRLLLVQPCKWDMRHFPNLTCTPVAFDNPGPSTHWFPRYCNNSYVCAACHCASWLWRARVPVVVSPLRSVWAPEPTNPFLCDNCYSEKIRAKRELHPRLRLLKCLCVRRENLHIFLINRRFYDEASRVFWTENTFAFENLVIMADFLESIRPQTRDMITKISVVADPDGGSLEPVLSRDVLRGMYWLRQCRGLTELELDECFLEKMSWVLKVKNVTPKTRVRFIRYEELSRSAFLGDWCPPVWKILKCRKDSQDPVAEKLAASMVRQRPLTNKAVRALFKRFRGSDGEVVREDDEESY